MNSSSDRGARPLAGRGPLIALALLVWAAWRPAHALSVHAVYRTACTRDVGVILRVEKRQVRLLRLDGTLVDIPRHEIVSLLYYPVTRLPLERPLASTEIPMLRATTRASGRVVDLVTGWPIDYSERKLSFLLADGEEVLVDRESLWSLAWEPARPPSTPARPPEKVVFVHPQTSGFCPDQAAPTSAPASQPAARLVFAQQILNDQVVIRRELDRLALAFAELEEQEGDQKFYPMPFLYRNRTMLGLWASLGSRHGASTSRSNNFTPLLIDELALGPFRYQHVLLSGAAPNDWFLHHEAQSQIYYRFKAAYFHTAVFLDPGLLLVGTKYGWREEDVGDATLDDRLNESFGIELGFDFGPLAIELTPIMLGQSAAKVGDFFDEDQTLNLVRAGARLTFPTWRVEAMGGFTSRGSSINRDELVNGAPMTVYYETGWDLAYGRVNLGVTPTPRLELALSGIARSLIYQARSGVRDHRLESLDLSFAATGSYALSHRLSIGGHVILETEGLDGGAGTTRRTSPKVGVFTGFWF